MQIEKSVDGHTATIKLAGKLTVQTAPRLAAVLKGLGNSITDLVIDLAGVDFIASAGLRVLVMADKLVARRKGSLRIVHPNDQVAKILDMAGLSDLLDIER